MHGRTGDLARVQVDFLADSIIFTSPKPVAMKTPFLLLMLMVPLISFSQWGIVDTLGTPSWNPDPYRRICHDVCMISPVKGFAGFTVSSPVPGTSESMMEMTGDCWTGSSVMFDYQCGGTDSAASQIINLSFLNDTVGWFILKGNAVCNRALFRTLNGVYFEPMTQPVNPLLACFSSPGTAWILGSDTVPDAGSFLLRFRNGFYDTIRLFPAGTSFNSMYFINDSTGFISHGSVFERTGDWGSTWSAIDNVSGNITAIRFPSQATGYALKPDNIIYKTTNGGLNWTATATPSGSALNSLFFTDDMTGTAVGNNGRIIRTSDGGNSWEVVSSPVSADLKRVQFVNGGVGFIFASGGILLKTFREAPAICRVTCDSSSRLNVISWDTTGAMLGDRYNIYRQLPGSTERLKIAEVPAGQANIYSDLTSTPSSGATSYSVSSTDSLGSESLKSSGHQTMFLEVVFDNTGGHFLRWSPYSGTTVDNYIVYSRILNGQWQAMGSVAANVFEFPAGAIPTQETSYLAGAACPVPCVSGPPTGNDPLSNIVDFQPAGIGQNTVSGVSIYPNPADDRLFIELGDERDANCKAEILSPDGKRLLKFSVSDKRMDVDVSGLNPGLYILVITNKDQVMTGKFIKR